MSIRFFLCSLLLLGAALMTGCGSPPCTGKQSCLCDESKPCDSGLTCFNGACTANPAEVTEEKSTTETGVGEPDTSQDAGPTDTARCTAGASGCRCTGIGECDKGLRCEKSLCQACPEGTAGCACKDGTTCGTGLKCENNICTGCVGKDNCACYNNKSCDTGLKCDASTHSQSLCKSCQDGEKTNCNCDKDGDCGTKLLCINKRCLDPAAMAQLPKNPKCYSPCEGNERQRDGSTRQCHPTHRLFEGCLVGQTCADGSCVPSEKAQQLSSHEYPYCTNDESCPAWQKCIQGRCYSNCDADADCIDGFSCHSYVCRRKCHLKKPLCAPEEACKNTGSTEDNGFCLPMITRRFDDPLRNKTDQTFVLSARELSLSNLENTAEIAITNQSQFASTIQITRESDTTGGKTPLSWINIDVCQTYTDTQRTQCKTFANKPTGKEPYSIDLPGNGRVILKVLGAEKATKSSNSYAGMLRVKSGQTEQRVSFKYRRSTSGRWQGKIYSFGNFDDTNIDKFPASPTLDLRDLKNALLRRWINFKRNELTFDQLRAVLLSIQTETWRLARVQKDCRQLFSTQASEDVMCFPYSSAKGYEILSYSQREAAVPSGLTSLDIALDVKELPNKQWQGRIVTSQTLHYPGDPQIKIEFAEQPGASNKSILTSLHAIADVGGRYYVEQNEGCANPNDFQKQLQPWFIPGFTLGSSPRSGSLFRERAECRSQLSPKSIPGNASDKQKADILAFNQSLNAANPIPNGRTLRRTIELVDGVLYENRILFAIVRERFSSPFAASGNAALSKDWVRYGYLWLQYTESDFKDEHAQGSTPKICTSDTNCSTGETCQSGVCQGNNQLRQVTCSPEIIKAASNRTLAKTEELRSWVATDLSNLVATLMGAQSADVTDNTALHITRTENNGDVEYAYSRDGFKRYIHFFCEDTKQFDGGPVDAPQDCPAGSKVVFFEHTTSEASMRAHTCHTTTDATKTCDNHLVHLRTDKDYRGDVPHRCVDKNAVFCDTNRKDLREGKLFFQPSTQSTFVSALAPLDNALFEAFRYRIKFQSRSGKSLGFTPELCSKTASSQIPYCYDPQVIEQLELRVNCLEAIFTDTTISQKLSTNTRATIKDFLTRTFSYTNRNSKGVIITDPGFETLNAELKVMLGDEAFTRALSSRYDLAATSLLSFDGDQLEPNGIRLSGVLGAEMYNLYLSIHYYQSVLDRFYAQTDTLAASFQSTTTAFLTAASVTSYVRKLLLAASRKTRSWSEVAKRYHQLNRSDLAQHVLERAYLSAYIEQIVLTQLLHNMMLVIDSKQIPQIRQDIERIMLTYNAALLDMQETHQQVLRKLDRFGFPEGYVPIPTLSRSAATSSPLNAFSTSLYTAKEKLAIAQQKEQIALQSNRSFDTDAASFQSEIVKLEQTYNEQLIQLCGGLQDGDRTVPAIPKYAHLYQSGQVDNPCGYAPGSHIYEAYAALERFSLDIPQLEQQRTDLYERIDGEAARIQKYCNDRFKLADITWQYQDKTKDLSLSKDTTDLIWQGVMRGLTNIVQISTTYQCIWIGGTAVNTECPTAAIAAGLKATILVAQESAVIALSLQVNNTKKEVAALQRDIAKINIQTPCNVCPPDNPTCDTEGAARIASQNYLAQLTLEIETYRLRLLNAHYQASLALSHVNLLRQRAMRLIQEQEDATTHLLDLQAAQSDPNVRIYKNDAIINAERTFEDALKEAYSLTLIYEYYTSTSYQRKQNLYLVRMASQGDNNLETYLNQLEQAYRDFEEQYGRPALRVLVLSLRDDILRIPRIDKNGQILGLQDRIKLFQEKLQDPKNYNSQGYLNFSFPITVDPKTSYVSPVTYSHKIVYLEAEIKATERGDDVGRIYIQQSGTGIIREQNDSYQYYSLPPRTAVLNPFFNGHKTFDPAIYQNYRLQDRPLGNTQWQLQFNQASEKANQDIALHSINDMSLYIYYQDFSKP